MAQAAILVVLLVALFPRTFISGEMIAPGDLLYRIPPWDRYAPEGFERPQNPVMSDVVTFVHPKYALVQRCLENGEWPLWNPLELTGMPLLANYQTAVFYPPRLLHVCRYIVGINFFTSLRRIR